MGIRQKIIKIPQTLYSRGFAGFYLCLEQMKAAEGVTEHMKQHDQMAWVGAMNSIRNRAEEIILRELIYEEDAV